MCGFAANSRPPGFSTEFHVMTNSIKSLNYQGHGCKEAMVLNGSTVTLVNVVVSSSIPVVTSAISNGFLPLSSNTTKSGSFAH